ncbi:MAG: endonuclease [Coriobacteriales bacterium]|nr:endonuclease [Coriobacteriales bacterium]
MARFFKVVFEIVAILIVLAAIFIGVLSVLEYNPASSEPIDIEGKTTRTLAQGDTLSMVSWNIGYGGLSPEADFFMDGGKSVQSVSEPGVLSNISHIQAYLAEQAPDIILLQEVDVDSARSYNINQSRMISNSFESNVYASAFAYNFNVLFVPYPFPPIGKVNSGILTLSAFDAGTKAERIQLPCPFSWPVRVFNLKRCLLVERLPVATKDGTTKELVVINLHLEAFDDGAGKEAQTAQLVKLLQSEYEKGNYVIAGGDFNQTFSTAETGAYPVQSEDIWQCGHLDASVFGEHFSAVMDAATPTCRSLDRPYDPTDEKFQYYMIDGFVVSDNIKINNLKTLDTGFEYSDHNPVRIEITLL